MLEVIMVDRIGVFRTEPRAEVFLEKSKSSGAVAGVFLFTLSEYYDADGLFGEQGQWVRWEEYQQHVYTRVWVVGKDGVLDQDKARDLQASTGWDGSMLSFGTGWDTLPCQVTVVADEYRGNVRYVGSWVNPYDSDPSRGQTSANPEMIKKLSAMYDAKLRAVLGPKPIAGSPPNPPAQDAPAPPGNDESPRLDENGTPF